MYRTYYAEMNKLPEIERSGCRTVNVYRDLHKRPVTSLSWQPDGGRRFAVTYVQMDLNRLPLKSTSANIWDLENSNSPDMSLLPPCPMLDLQFSPRDENLLVGALVNGQVTAFDRRYSELPTGTCPPHVAHRDLVRKVVFISSKSGQEFFSAGPDGVCKWWDLRKFDEPTDVMIMDIVKTATDVQSMATANGVTMIEYEPTIPTRFMVGTENGLVISCNRKGKTALEKLPVKVSCHSGLAQTIDFSQLNCLVVG